MCSFHCLGLGVSFPLVHSHVLIHSQGLAGLFWQGTQLVLGLHISQVAGLCYRERHLLICHCTVIDVRRINWEITIFKFGHLVKWSEEKVT